MSEIDISLNTPFRTQILLGHDETVKSFTQAVTGQRVAHGWLFTGPEGVGKMTFALLVARATLNAGPPSSPQDIQQSYDSLAGKLVSQAVHPDLRIISCEKEGKKHIEVDDIRELKNFFAHSAGSAGWRVAIIDSVDDMTRNAANALLKILEEPPAKCLIILISHNAGKVIDTIRSRSRKLVFHGLDEKTILTIVKSISPETDQNIIGAASFLSNASAGRALTLIDQGGLEHYKALMEAIVAINQSDIAQTHAFCDFVAHRDAPERFSLFIELLSDWLYRLTKVSRGLAEFQAIFETEHQLIEKYNRASGKQQIFDLWENIQDIGRETTALNLDKKQAALNCLTMVNALL